MIYFLFILCKDNLHFDIRPARGLVMAYEVLQLYVNIYLWFKSYWHIYS